MPCPPLLVPVLPALPGPLFAREVLPAGGQVRYASDVDAGGFAREARPLGGAPCRRYLLAIVSV